MRIYTVYILFSVSSGRTYVGYTNNLERRLAEHNLAHSKGFTRRYRPWALIHCETFNNKTGAMAREKYFKSGVGRLQVREIIKRITNADIN